MKLKFIPVAIILIAVLFNACENAADNLGVSIQPTADKIYLAQDTFHLTSETEPVDNIISIPDSLLLGTFIDDNLGTTRADILTQLALPTTGFTYLDESVAKTTPDSVVLKMYFNSYFGLTTSPFEVNVYELKKGLTASQNYYSNLDPTEYVDFSKKLNANSELYTVKNGLTDSILSNISIKLSDDFLNRFFTKDPQVFKSQADFQNFFKGLYVTTNFGSSTLINVSSLYVTLYYHYIYNNDTAVIKSYHSFPANSEIVKVNRVMHPNRTLVLSPNDEYNYVVSPANYQTKVRIPLARIRQRIKDKVGSKELSINSAILKLNVQNQSVWGTNSVIPYVSNMLLVKESAMNNFFRNHELPSDTVALLSTLASESVTSTTYKYSYTFTNLSTLIKNELEKNNTDEYLDMVLVPVSVTTSSSTSSTTITAVNENTQMQGVSIYSGKNKDIPMKLEMVFSGF